MGTCITGSVSLNEIIVVFSTSQIIDSIIEESKKGSAGEVGEVAQLLDQLHVDVTAEPEPKEEINAQEVPVEIAAADVKPQLVERQEEQQESAATNGACSIPAPHPADLPGPSAGSQELVQPPDITSTIGQTQSYRAVVVAEGEQEQRPADILEQVPFTDGSADSDSSGPTKPPRQFTVEPDIVASTKKPPPFHAHPLPVEVLRQDRLPHRCRLFPPRGLRSV